MILNGTKAPSNKGHIPIVGSGGIFGYTNKAKTIGKSISLPRKGTMEILFYKEPVWNVDTAYLIESVSKEIVNIDYLFYLLQDSEWKKLITGSTRPAMTKSDWSTYCINIPPLSEQEKIIEIIKPFEDAISNINEQVNLIKEILINKYNLSNSSREYFCKYIKLHANNYSNQTEYLATNAIGEFTVDYSKTQDIKSDRPSRADLTPEPNSIIISKLDGENKVLYIPRKFSYVVSTGFFNFRTEYLDHVVGFLLSEDYKKQKTMLATGTTMVGLNSDGLNQIKFKFPTDKSSSLTKYSNELLNIKSELENQREIIIKLLIK